jgi:hypothetical protein
MYEAAAFIAASRNHVTTCGALPGSNITRTSDACLLKRLPRTWRLRAGRLVLTQQPPQDYLVSHCGKPYRLPRTCHSLVITFLQWTNDEADMRRLSHLKHWRRTLSLSRTSELSSPGKRAKDERKRTDGERKRKNDKLQNLYSMRLHIEQHFEEYLKLLQKYHAARPKYDPDCPRNTKGGVTNPRHRIYAYTDCAEGWV